MKKNLFVNACVRPKSRTRELAELALGQMVGNPTLNAGAVGGQNNGFGNGR